MAADTFDRVKKIIVEQLGVEPNEVTPEASITDDLGADSLDQVELVMAFETEFGIDIPDEEAEKNKSVGDPGTKIDAVLAAKKYRKHRRPCCKHSSSASARSSIGWRTAAGSMSRTLPTYCEKCASRCSR